jgi:hypothetical protein
VSGYASDTAVSPEKTKAAIEATLRRYGADSFVSGWDGDRAFVMFRAKDRLVRFVLQFPARTDRRVAATPAGKVRGPAQREEAYGQLVRSYWRRLLLVIKAKLESVSSGVETFEESFLAQIVLPDNSTVGQWAKAAIPEAYATGGQPRGLLALPPANGEVAT